MKKNGISRTLLAAFCLLSAGLAHAASLQEFEWTAPVKAHTTTSEIARVPIPATVISKTQSGFMDLRLYDGQGKETPYVIYEDFAPAVPKRTLTLSLKEFAETETADLYVLEKAQRSEKIESIEVITGNHDFRKTVRVEGSTDKQAWTPLTEDAIFDYSSRVNLRKIRVPLPESDAPFLRITISKETGMPKETDELHLKYKDLEFSTNGAQTTPFKVDNFIGHSGGNKQDSRIEDGVILTHPKTTPDGKGNTAIDLGEVRLPLSKIVLEVEDPYFYRPAEIQFSDTGEDGTYQTIFTGMIHRIPGAAQPGLELVVNTPLAPFVRIRVRDGDNPPLTINRARLTWNRRVLYFHPRPAETYSLYFGNQDVTSPNYETAQLIKNDALALRALPEWTTGPVVHNAAFTPTWGKAEKEEFQGWMLNFLVILLLVGLGGWGVMIVKRLPKSE